MFNVFPMSPGITNRFIFTVMPKYSSDSPMLREDLSLSQCPPYFFHVQWPQSPRPWSCFKDCLLPLNYLCLCEDHNKQGGVKGWAGWALVSSLPNNFYQYSPRTHCQLNLQSKLKFEHTISFKISVLASPSNNIAFPNLPCKATINAKVMEYWDLVMLIIERMTPFKHFATLCHVEPNQA